MPLTQEEKVLIKFHMGYPTQEILRSMFAGFPTLNQSNWQIDAVLSNPLAEETLPLLRNILKQLENIMWGDMVEARLEDKVQRIEEITINLQHQPMLAKNYRFWQQRMAQCLCVPVNPDMDGALDIYGGGVRNFTVH